MYIKESFVGWHEFIAVSSAVNEVLVRVPDFTAIENWIFSSFKKENSLKVKFTVGIAAKTVENVTATVKVRLLVPV